MKVMNVETRAVGTENFATTLELVGDSLFFRYNVTDAILIKSVLEKKRGQWGVAVPVNSPGNQFITVLRDGKNLTVLTKVDELREFEGSDALSIVQSIALSYDESRQSNVVELVQPM